MVSLVVRRGRALEAARVRVRERVRVGARGRGAEGMQQRALDWRRGGLHHVARCRIGR